MRVLPRRAVLLAPSAVALLGGATLLVLDQRARVAPLPSLPGLGDSSPLVGRTLPAFSLPGLDGGRGFSSVDVAAARWPVLLNFFGSWCAPCRQEMSLLTALSQQGVAVWGIAYEDKPAATAAFLKSAGDPYQRVCCDLDGRVGDRAFKLVGVPESFLVDPGGVVRWSWAGKLEPDVVRRKLTPLLKQSLRGP